jgi:hypothetical protein
MGLSAPETSKQLSGTLDWVCRSAQDFHRQTVSDAHFAEPGRNDRARLLCAIALLKIRDLEGGGISTL